MSDSWPSGSRFRYYDDHDRRSRVVVTRRLIRCLSLLGNTQEATYLEKTLSRKTWIWIISKWKRIRLKYIALTSLSRDRSLFYAEAMYFSKCFSKRKGLNV